VDALAGLQPVIEANAQALLQPGVLGVRPGYRRDAQGRLTKDKAVVAVLAPGAKPQLPAQVGGFPVDVREADEVEQLRAQQPDKYVQIAGVRAEFRTGAFPEAGPLAEAALPPGAAPEVLATKPQLPYTPPDGVALDPVTGAISILCHASPDAGWPTLKEFLSKTQRTLTVGLYDFTSGHILEAMEADFAGPKTLTITLDNPAKNPSADQTDPETLKALHDEMGDSLQAAWALNRMNRDIKRWIVPNAYHIKVAVRDGKTVWLSSGNWNNSNQPDFDPINAPSAGDQDTAKKSDRDWHVVIDHPGLAATFEAYLKHDYDVAHQEAVDGNAPVPEAAQPAENPVEFAPEPVGTFEFHAPQAVNENMTVTPLLTPDPGVYIDAMTELVKSAQTSLYIQLQYIHPSDKDPDAKFTDLVDAVVQKIGAGVDVRIIVSQWQTTNGWLDRLQSAGVDLANVRIQNGVHNKGFVVDHKRVALGSQNWSGDGVLRNRDASVILDNETAAKYYEQIFLHDWDRIAQPAGA
jgi:PLD-like domain